MGSNLDYDVDLTELCEEMTRAGVRVWGMVAKRPGGEFIGSLPDWWEVADISTGGAACVWGRGTSPAAAIQEAIVALKVRRKEMS